MPIRFYRSPLIHPMIPAWMHGIAIIGLLLLLSLLAGTARAQERVYLDITSPDIRKVPLAVPAFMDKGRPGQIDAKGREMAAILARGLAFHGFIKPLPLAAGNDSQDMDWQAAGADFVALGQYSTSASGIVVELRLLDVLEGQMVFGRRYRGPWKKRRQMILKFCDEVILHLTGELGISRSRIAFISDASGASEVYIADVLGDEVRQVTRHRSHTTSPRFSPDGNRLAYTSYHAGNPNLYITNLAQSANTRAISRRKGLNMAPAWSPDGQKMVLTLSKDDNPDLYLMTTKGVILQRLTENSGINVSPDWSPDGRSLAFVSDRSGTPQLYIMDMKTRATKRITFQGSDNTEPNWSPKGDWIAYSGLQNGEYHLFMIRPEGGAPVKLTKTVGNHESPSWSPDGRQLVFSRALGDKKQICAIHKNGTGMRILFTLDGQQSHPRWSPRPEDRTRSKP